jgi:thiol-disulfide isomerase/thioredoxin
MKMKLLLSAVMLSVMCGVNVNASEVGEVAPQFTLPTLQQGEAVSLEKYKGKVVYLDFWASWCAPCRTSFPLLNELHQKLKDKGFEVLAVNQDEDEAKAKKFLEEIPVSFTVVRDATGEWSDKYVVESMPTSFLIDQQGVIQNIHHGFVSDDIKEIENKVVELLGKK